METYRKVNKIKARKLFNNGVKLKLLPCKINQCVLYGNNPWMRPFEVSLELSVVKHLIDDGKGDIFDFVVRHYEYYNCNNEVGKYTSFYVSEKDLEISNMCELMCN